MGFEKSEHFVRNLFQNRIPRYLLRIWTFWTVREKTSSMSIEFECITFTYNLNKLFQIITLGWMENNEGKF